MYTCLLSIHSENLLQFSLRGRTFDLKREKLRVVSGAMNQQREQFHEVHATETLEPRQEYNCQKKEEISK